MIETIIYIYLAGWAGTTIYLASDCEQTRFTKKECIVESAKASSMWPVVLPVAIVGSRMH